jgi:DNA-binding response OmpR family regulator
MTAFNLAVHENTIVVVNEEPDLVTSIEGFLKDDGYNVIRASNVTQLFNGLEKQMPDLIILTVVMSQMDGLEVLARLKGDRETSSIPVILLTEKTQYQDIWTGYNLGADYYVTKPFTRTQLLGANQSHL